MPPTFTRVMLVNGSGQPVNDVAVVASLSVESGQTVSTNAVTAGGYSGYGIVVPSTFDGTTLSFQVSSDGVTYQALYDIAGNLVTIPVVAASRSYDAPGELSKWPHWKLVCGTAQSGSTTVFPIVGRV